MAHQCPPAPITTPMLTGPSFADPIVTAEGDRGLPTWAWIAWFNQLLECIGHAEAGGEREFMFNLAAGDLPVTLGTNKTPPRVITYNATCTLLEVCAVARDAPTGANLIMDLKLNGVSVFNASKLTIPAGSTSITTVTSFAVNPTTFGYHSIFTMDVLQIGSTYAGRAIFIGGRYRLS